ncbi:MAG: S8 family serine peptidase [Alphaproteobacteria bacterium]
MIHRFRTGLVGAAAAAFLIAGWVMAPSQAPGQGAAAETRVFVHANDNGHKRALIAIANQGMRHQFSSPGNELSFSATLTRGQVQAMKRLGATIEAVPQVYPQNLPRQYGALKGRGAPAGKPGAVCGDNICDGGEKKSCPADCTAGDGEEEPPPPTERACAPQDQREYQTLLLSGATAGPSAGADDGTGVPVRILVIDTGVNRNHPDLDVTWCKDTTSPRIKNNCKDDIGHGTHTAGSAAAYGGDDGLGLFGAAPGATLGVAKICGKMFCFMDDLIRAIEVGSADFDPHVISLSFGGPDSTTFHNAVQDAVSAGALFVSSAGNDGPGNNSISYPAIYPEVVAVGILDANRIANRMSGRGVDDGNDTTISAGEVELAGGGFVIESTSKSGCYEVMSGTSMSAPSVAGFAAANWQGNQSATRAFLVAALTADDVDNSAITEYADGTTSGYDVVTGYGLPRTGAGIDGVDLVGVTVAVTATPQNNGTVGFLVTGPAGSIYRIGIGSPDGSWTYGEFTTTANGDSGLTLTPWNDPGGWLVTVDFGDGATGFEAASDSFTLPLD